MDTSDSSPRLDPLTAFYADALELLVASRLPFLVGGTFAYARYTGIDRETKDMDVFVRPSDLARTLATFEDAGYVSEVPYPHWLAKVSHAEHVMDIVFGSGNGIALVDDEWFFHAPEAEVLGVQVRLCPPEEMIWSKAFVQERERFDGADVLHLLRDTAQTLDWDRLLARFADQWPVLLSHLVLFRYVYPDRRDDIPSAVIRELTRRMLDQKAEPDHHVCYGSLLSREQYLHDTQQLGYLDARVQPLGGMTRTEATIWTDAIKKDE